MDQFRNAFEMDRYMAPFVRNLIADTMDSPPPKMVEYLSFGIRRLSACPAYALDTLVSGYFEMDYKYVWSLVSGHAYHSILGFYRSGTAEYPLKIPIKYKIGDEEVVSYTGGFIDMYEPHYDLDIVTEMKPFDHRFMFPFNEWTFYYRKKTMEEIAQLFLYAGALTVKRVLNGEKVKPIIARLIYYQRVRPPFMYEKQLSADDCQMLAKQLLFRGKLLFKSFHSGEPIPEKYKEPGRCRYCKVRRCKSRIK
jgi:hypothetical protein